MIGKHRPHKLFLVSYACVSMDTYLLVLKGVGVIYILWKDSVYEKIIRFISDWY